MREGGISGKLSGGRQSGGQHEHYLRAVHTNPSVKFRFESKPSSSGNIAAAAANLRTLPGERDHNRIWPGAPLAEDEPQVRMARAVYDYVERRQPFAAIEANRRLASGNQGDLLACMGVPLDRPIGIATKQIKEMMARA